jgi:hypothetical protein
MTTYLNLEGVERPVRFGFGALYQYEQRTGRNALEDFAKMANGTVSITLMVDLLFAGLVAGHRHEKVAITFNQDDVAEWMTPDVLNQTAALFTESFPAEPQEGDGEKKTKPPKVKAMA